MSKVNPFLKLYACSESVTDADYLDIDYSTAGFLKEPNISVTAIDNINIFISNITQTTARVNFSAKYTGTIHYVCNRYTE